LATLASGIAGISGTFTAGSAVRATGDESAVAAGALEEFAIVELGEPTAFGGSIEIVSGDQFGATSPAGIVLAAAPPELNGGAVSAEYAGGEVVSPTPPATLPPPISSGPALHWPTPSGITGSVSLIFKYSTTPTAASSVMVISGRRELTAQSSGQASGRFLKSAPQSRRETVARRIVENPHRRCYATFTAC
jgi:hypothetical protein